MVEPTRQAYRKALKTWTMGAAAVAAALAVVAAYFGYVTADLGSAYRILRAGAWLVLLAFLIPSLYFLVLGVLPEAEPAEPAEPAKEPRRPLNP